MSLNDFLAELKEQAVYMEADDDKKKKKDDKKEEDKKEDTPPPVEGGGDPLQSDTDDNADDAPEDLGAGDPDADGDGTDDEPDDLSGGDDPADDEPGDDDEEAPEEPDMDADDEGDDTGEDDPLDDEGGDDEPDDLGGDDTPDAGGDDGDMEPDDLGDDGGDSEGGDDTPDAGDDGDMGSGDGGSGNPDDIKGLENEIFADLSDEQKAIRTKELKDRFVELYNLTLAFKEKVDYVKKTSDNMQVITRVSKTLDKLSDMISHYINKTFNTKSYIENKSDFYYCLWVLDRINELMGTLTPKEPIKK